MKKLFILLLSIFTISTLLANLGVQDGPCPSGCPCTGQGLPNGLPNGGPMGPNAPGMGNGGGGGTCGGGNGTPPAIATSRNNSVDLTITFGNPATERMSLDARFSIYSAKPTPTIYSPQMLQYLNPFLNRISQNVISESHKDSIGLSYASNGSAKMMMAQAPVGAQANNNTEDVFLGGYTENTISSSLPSGVTHQARFIGPNREALLFNFTEDDSTAKMTGETSYLGYQLKMTNQSGEPVTSNPYYYDLYIGYGNFVRYMVSTGYPVSYHTASGRVLKPSDPSVGLDAVYDQDGILRQVRSLSDGLADIVVTEGLVSYEIRFYAPSQVGEKTDGIYQTTGEPHTVFCIENPNTNTNTEVAITKTVGGVDYRTLYRYSHNSEGWVMYSPGDLSVDSKTTMYDYSHTVRTVNSVIKTPAGQVAKKSTDVYQEFSFGDRLVASTIDPDGLALRTSYTYFTDSSNQGSLGRIATESLADGSWNTYSYNDNGWQKKVISSYLNAAFNSSASESMETTLSYAPHDSRDIIVSEDKRPRTTEIKILGKTVSKIFKAYYFDGDSYFEIEEKAITPNATWGTESNLRTTWEYYPKGNGLTSASAGRVKQITYPDGTTKSYTYEYGNLQQSSANNTYSFSVGNGNALRVYVTNGTVDFPSGIANKTTREEQLYDVYGNLVFTSTQIYTSSNYETATWVRNSYDEQHRLLTELKSNGELTQTTWNCCQKSSETLPDGTQYTYVHDALLRLVAKIKKGVGNQKDITTLYEYNAAGQLLSETISGGDLSLTESTEYNFAGLMTKKIDKQGLVTTFDYLRPINTGANRRGLTVTATLPGGATQVYSTYLDKQQNSLTGTAQTPKYYNYGVNDDGSLWRKELIGGGDSPRRTVTTLGMNKSLKSVVNSGFGGDVTENYFYNTKNQLIKLTKTNQAPVLISYDEIGNRGKIGLDIDEDGTLSATSNDRILEELYSFESDNGWWQTITSKTYATANSNAQTLLKRESVRLNNFANNTISEARIIDINGNVTTRTLSFDRNAKKSLKSTLYPDSEIAEFVESINGLVTIERSKTNLTTTYQYDDLARLIEATEPRIGTTTLAYHTVNGKNSMVSSVTDAAGNKTEFDYDIVAGRLISVKNALGKYTSFAYNDYNLITNVWGETQYPLEFSYNIYGQQIGMKTYRNTTVNFGGSTFPSATGDATSWTYDQASGLVIAKTDANNKSVNYTYTVDGKLATRTWARGIATNYNYDNATGQLLKVDYADNTTDITYTYNRLGNFATVQDAAGTRIFNYDSALNRIGEVIDGVYNKTLTYNYATTGVKGRYTGFSLDNASNSVYSYDSYGRLNQITGLGGNFNYSRLANSELIENLTRPNAVNTTWAYEAHRNLITQVGNGNVSTFGYINDVLGRRTSMARSGSAFTAPDILSYTYNDRSEVIGANSNVNTNYNYNYNFDPIGNRVSASLQDENFSYTTNMLNQYTAINIQNPTYDDDGNMLTRDGWTQTWNGENRLIETIKGTQKLQFAYDYMGRRIEKKVYDGETLTKFTRFVYNDYKLIEELDALNGNASLRKYTWQPMELGLDVPLSVYDAENNATYFYTTDANKNVSELTDAEGNVVAHYEYSPFGVQTKATGAYAQCNSFCFSSEYYDTETELVYYNYRYYDTQLGRWLSRDPIEEQGGINLYAMVENSSISKIDNLGLYVESAWDVTSLLVGLYDANNNFWNGNWGDGFIDLGGAAIDALALALPGVPGGVGIGKRAIREAAEIAAREAAEKAAKKPCFPDAVWSNKAPKQTTPGTKTIEHYRFNPKTGKLEHSTVKYDDYGRQIERTDMTDHGYPNNHTNPHTHKTEYNQQFPSGKETRQ